MNNTAVISDTISHVVYYNQDNGYIVLSTKKGNTLTGCYSITNKRELQGVEIIAYGSWVKNKKFGVQFRFESLEIKEDPLFYFLSKVVKGVGESLAKTILKTLGGEKRTEEILDKGEIGELLFVKGIKNKKAQNIIESWAQYKHIKKLSQFLTPYGVTTNTIFRIYEHFKEDIEKRNLNIIKLLKENIYIITKVPGIGFKSADKIALSTGIAINNKNRIQACIEYTLYKSTNDDGNSCLNIETILGKVQEELLIDNDDDKISIDEKNILENIKEMTGSSKLISVGENKITLPFLYHYETQILSYANNRNKSGFDYIIPQAQINSYIQSKEKEMGFSFSEEQKLGIVKINQGKKFFLLYGYAGTGKSTISKIILDLYNKKYNKNSIVCCALSGIASDKIRKKTGYPSYTIHSLILSKNQSILEDCKVILIDEASMVNSEILYKLFKALSYDCTIIMVGDPAQLPPIGAGNPFVDLIECGKFSQVELTQIFRQSEQSVIAYFANQIREGVAPYNFAKNIYDDWVFKTVEIDNFWELKRKVKEKKIDKKVVETARANNNNQILQEITHVTKQHTEILAKMLQQKKFNDYITFFQVITPVKNGLLGTININNVLQKVLNPIKHINDRTKNYIQLKDYRLYPIDKVIHTKNKVMDSYIAPNFLNGNKTQNKIYNGMIGIVAQIDKENELVYVYYPNDRMMVEYTLQEAKDMLILAYALTGHKTQGSQFKHVVIPISFSHFIMNNVKLIYTVITRAEKKVYLVGEKSAFKIACSRTEEVKRDTIIQQMCAKVNL